MGHWRGLFRLGTVRAVPGDIVVARGHGVQSFVRVGIHALHVRGIVGSAGVGIVKIVVVLKQMESLCKWRSFLGECNAVLGGFFFFVRIEMKEFLCVIASSRGAVCGCIDGNFLSWSVCVRCVLHDAEVGMRQRTFVIFVWLVP